MYLFYCEQVGTLNYLAPVFEKLSKLRINFLIFSNRDFSSKKINYKIENIKLKKMKKKLFHLLVKKKVKKVICSLTINSYIQKKIIDSCKSQKIPTIGILDFWVNIRERFFFKNKQKILPDKILNIDHFTKKKLLRLGISENKIITVGHPYFENIEKIKFRTFKQKNILFISQPINKNNKIKFKLNKNFFINNYFRLSKKIDQKLIFILHPDINISKKNKSKIGPIDTLNIEKLKKSIGIIGLYSSVIVSALLLNKPVYVLKKNKEFLNNDFVSHYKFNKKIFYNLEKFNSSIKISIKKKKFFFFRNSTNLVLNSILS